MSHIVNMILYLIYGVYKMIYFTGVVYSSHEEQKMIYVEVKDSMSVIDLAIKIFTEIQDYLNKYDLELPGEGYFGAMPCLDENGDCIEDCEYAQVEMIDSNAFDTEDDFDILWDDFLDAVAKGKVR